MSSLLFIDEMKKQILQKMLSLFADSATRVFLDEFQRSHGIRQFRYTFHSNMYPGLYCNLMTEFICDYSNNYFMEEPVRDHERDNTPLGENSNRWNKYSILIQNVIYSHVAARMVNKLTKPKKMEYNIMHFHLKSVLTLDWPSICSKLFQINHDIS